MRNAVLIAKKCRLGSDSETALFLLSAHSISANSPATMVAVIEGGGSGLLKRLIRF